MAENYTGVPTTDAPEEQPGDLLRIDATPASFGAPLAEGAEDVGRGILDASKFYSQVAADHATNNYLAARTKILNGDPSQPALDQDGNPILGPDGQPLPDTGFLGKNGMDAMHGAANASAALDEMIQEQRAGLSTPAARQAFDNQSRRFRAQDAETIATHARTQTVEWAKQTNADTINGALNRIAQHADDPFATAQDQELVRQAYVKNAQLVSGYSDPAAVANATLKADQMIAVKRVDALLGQNTPESVAAAQKTFEGASGVLGSLPQYGQMAREVKSAVANSTVNTATDQFVNQALAEAKSAAVASAVSAKSIGAISNGQSLGSLTAGQAQAFSANPGKFIGDILGTGPLQVNSSVRSAEVNARTPGSSPTSEHIPGNGFAADLQLPPGMSHADAIAKIRAAGLPVDQFEIDGGALHVGFRPVGVAGRNMVIGQGAQAGGGQYPTSADYINAHMSDLVDKARAFAQANPQWQNMPDVQDRYVQGVERRLNQQVEQLHRSYESDTHMVQSAMVSDHPPISEQELMASSPAVAAAWRRMQVENPLGAAAVEKQFNVNPFGMAKEYGVGFHDFFDRVTAPQTDPNRLENPAQLSAFVGSGPDAALTNSGVYQLAQLQLIRKSPSGEADITQIRNAMNQIHGDLTFSNRATGVVDVNGEKLYSKFSAAALPVLLKAQQAGTLGDVLNPKSPDYIGNMANSIARTPDKLLHDRVNYGISTEFSKGHFNPEGVNPALHHPLAGPAYTVNSWRDTLASLENPRQRREALMDARASGRLSPDVERAYVATLPPSLQGPARTNTASGPAFTVESFDHGMAGLQSEQQREAFARSALASRRITPQAYREWLGRKHDPLAPEAFAAPTPHVQLPSQTPEDGGGDE